MKKFKKNLIALMLAMVLVLSATVPSFAAEELPTEAVYDLEKGGEQTFTIRDADGSIDTVTVREISSGNARVADGTYEVGYNNTGAWTASFLINVSANKLYNPHDPFCYAWTGSINYPTLARPSTTYAYLAFIYDYGILSFRTGVDANITNGNIIVTKR